MPFNRPHPITIRLSAAELATLNEIVVDSGLGRADVMRLALRQYSGEVTADADAERGLSAAFDCVREHPETPTPAQPEPGPIPGCPAREGEA